MFPYFSEGPGLYEADPGAEYRGKKGKQHGENRDPHIIRQQSLIKISPCMMAPVICGRRTVTMEMRRLKIKSARYQIHGIPQADKRWANGFQD